MASIEDSIAQLIASQEEHNKKAILFQTSVMDHIQKIERGVYGDRPNGVKGLIERQQEDEIAIINLNQKIDTVDAKHTKFREKLQWIWGGVVTVAGLAWAFIADYVKALIK